MSVQCPQVREIKETKGESIGELYHSLSFSLIELMLKEPDYQVYLTIHRVCDVCFYDQTGCGNKMFCSFCQIQFVHLVSLVVTVEFCTIVDFVNFLIFQVGVSLAYYNLKSELPTQSSVIAWSRPAELRPQTATKRQATTVHSSAFHLPKAEAFLLTIPLPKALDELLADLRATIGSPQSPAVIEATSLLPAETAL
jgi:hypothetical protein